MKKMKAIFPILILIIPIIACKLPMEILAVSSPSPTFTITIEATETSTVIPSLTSTETQAPTETQVPTETHTLEPSSTLSPTALPGQQVFSIDSLAKEIPWLPRDSNTDPGINFASFNTEKPPFNDVLIRQAFSYAIDRDAITEMAVRYNARNARPATVFTPPEVLGRDLFGEVGINFDPQKAKELFSDAGYSDPSSFPLVKYLVNVSGETAPGAHLNIANAMAEMWKEHLDVSVDVEVVANWGNYLDILRDDPPEIYRLGWAADYNDPDNFLGVFHSESENNFGNFSNTEFDRLVDSAAGRTQDPEKRQVLYIQAEYILCEEEAAVIPLYFLTYDR